ncbi:MAG: T9SS type A sorting domain-containing protein, partial [Ignavibacteria bacterium]|nr:T9SS type A sorting domain-containing protein [Ignavibacteria bacterium]
SWDEGTVFVQSVILVGDTLKMWYGGNSDSHIFNNNFSIGYAWSLDGINWTKYNGNPVMDGRPGMWDQVGVFHPIVIQDGDTLRMWYESFTASTPAGPGHMIGYATSVNGITWTRRDAPVLERGPVGEWDDSYIVTGAVIKNGNTYKMWYSGGTGGTFPGAFMRMGLVISTDGINWTKYDDTTTTNPPFQFSDPVIPLGSPGSWEALWAWAPSVLSTPAGYEMWYEGIRTATDNAAVGYATSIDGVNWIKDNNNPILTGVTGSWASALGVTSVIKDGDLYRMWLSGLPDFFPFPGRIGYATAPVITGADEKPQILNEFCLHQNYPNPFNPSTKIKYSIPNEAIVIIKVYDILGNEVKTLVNEEKIIGNYEIEFDGRNLSSGIYLYRMQAGIFNDTKKLILIR